MDKLQPLLKNHFWILLVPLFSMNLWGYFSANGALKAATKSRVETLDKVKSGIPAGSTDPNEIYTTELKSRNELLEKYVDEELLDLWKRQQARMVWPGGVAPDIPKIYLADIKNNLVRFSYQKAYPEAVRKLHESVEPFVANKAGITWTPKVDFPKDLIPRMKIGTLTINSTQMWHAQEDIWVTQFILDAIREMNKDADSETSAVIRRVIAFRLLGGDGVPIADGTVTATGGSKSGGGSQEMDPAAAGHGAHGAPAAAFSQGGGGGGMGGTANSSIAINPVEEFGAGGDLGAGGTGMSSASPSTASPMGDPAAPAVPTGPLRYVKDTPEAPYVERGFYLSVIINQNKMVDFLVALSNSEWPVRVVRFHFGKNPYATDPFTAAGATGGNLASNMNMNMNMGQGFGGKGSGSGDPFASNLDGFNPGGFGGPAGAPGTVAVYPLDALQHPDLVQLDLLGIVTMYRQPASEIAALQAAADAAAAGTITSTPDATGAEAPADPATVTPATVIPATGTPVDPAAPAAGTPPTDAPAAEAGTPTPAPESPAPAAGTPAEGTPVVPPAGTEPAPAAPAAPAPAPETPPATEAPPAEPPATP